MWFKRKPQNRKLAREFVLDVRLRSSQVRATRARMAAVALAVVFATVLGVYLLWRTGGWALNRLFYENNAFAIETIDVQTDGSIPPEQLRQWSGVRTGQNLLALDMERVRRDLELVSMIKSAAVERIPPRTLRVRVIEREPVAQVNLFRPAAKGGIESKTLQVDAEGYVILPLESAPQATATSAPAEALPLLVGPSACDLQPGHRLESPQVQAALRLVVDFDQSPMAGLLELKRVDASNPDVLVATTGQGSEVTFALNNLDQQLRRWKEIFEFGQKQSKAIARLDLAITNNIPATWLEASSLPASNPKRPKSLKKKHV